MSGETERDVKNSHQRNSGVECPLFQTNPLTSRRSTWRHYRAFRRGQVPNRERRVKSKPGPMIDQSHRSAGSSSLPNLLQIIQRVVFSPSFFASSVEKR